MKEFDYDKAYAGAAVCTKGGLPVRIVCWDADIRYDGNKYPILALVSRYKDKVANEAPVSYTEDGKELRGMDSRFDLAMAPVKHEGWVNLFKVGEHDIVAEQRVYPSEESAKSASRDKDYYLTSVKAEWEE